MTTAPGRRTPSVAGLHPLLFAAYPVLFLWSQNLGEADAGDVVLPLLAVVLAAGAATWVAGRLLGDVRRGALAVTPLVVGGLMYGHVAEIASGLHVRPLLQQAGWAALALLAVVAALRLGIRRVAGLDRLLTSVAAILVLVAVVTIVPSEVSALSRPAPAGVGELPAVTSAPKRDVYYLVFDRYGSDRALELRFGLRNDMSGWLRDRGFTVLVDSHANYVRSVLSMAATLNMTHLDGLAAEMGADSPDLGPADALLQGPLVARQFQALGYRYVHIGAWWQPTREDEAADTNLHAPGPSEFVQALFKASAVPVAVRRLHLPVSLGSKEDEEYDNARFALDALEGLVDDPGPKFVLAHVLLPHSPYVFDADGSRMPRGYGARNPVDGHRRQLEYTNLRLRALFERLLALPEPERPIIILQADEGPWSPGWSRAHAAGKRTYDWATADPEELEMKFGIMNAWYLPGGEDLGLYPTMTSVNTFPVLFGRYFGLDAALLPDTVYGSAGWTRPYDLVEITGRLPSLR